ncbi:MAG: AbrB/MazE/SpoVT family DNA-binding domain-containing protein [Kiritimatiellae bacterium]|nr:AbrB/MazE/SpoVT family DNA-binding domain-containing protein [Kiritimatiellia bacterium]
MKTRLIAVGNSRGVRIPKPLIQQCGLTDEVELVVQDNSIVIHSPRKPREGWGAAFAQMAQLKDDRLLDPDSPPSRWDAEEWEWK